MTDDLRWGPRMGLRFNLNAIVTVVTDKIALVG